MSKFYKILKNKIMNIELTEQEIEFISENFKAQLELVEEEKLTLSGTSQMIMENIIDKLNDNEKSN